jgi:hypothetical protein
MPPEGQDDLPIPLQTKHLAIWGTPKSPKSIIGSRGFLDRGLLMVATTTSGRFIPLFLTGDKVPRELAASGIEHRNRAENRAVYGA